jgi:hypothetical protein
MVENILGAGDDVKLSMEGGWSGGRKDGITGVKIG